VRSTPALKQQPTEDIPFTLEQYPRKRHGTQTTRRACVDGRQTQKIRPPPTRRRQQHRFCCLVGGRGEHHHGFGWTVSGPMPRSRKSSNREAATYAPSKNRALACPKNKNRRATAVVGVTRTTPSNEICLHYPSSPFRTDGPTPNGMEQLQHPSSHSTPQLEAKNRYGYEPITRTLPSLLLHHIQ